MMRFGPVPAALLAMTMAFLWGGPCVSRAATPEQVDAAIQNGIKYIYSLQQPNGTWERAEQFGPQFGRGDVEGGAWGGLTAMATVTLLAAGQDPKDPRLARAIDFLKQADLKGTYAVALRAQIWQYLDYEHSPDIRSYIQRDTDILLNSIQTIGEARGMYGYWVRTGDKENWHDHSNSQLAVLGVWSLAETHVVEIPTAYWQMVQQGWINAQFPDGAWNYQLHDEASNTEFARHSLNLTSAGVATLYITQDYLRGEAGCHGNFDSPNIEAGVNWIIANYAAEIDRPRDLGQWHPLHYYGLYGSERVGQASGRKYFGTMDWFKTGCDLLLGHGVDGNWGALPDTCFAMLFLVHGHAPVMFNKLEYNINMHGDKTKESNWNQRPHDALRIARWTGKMTELEFNWQIVNLNVPVDELHDAPILYVAGDQTLDFTAEEQAKLKQFCEDGGLILFNADCGSSRFSKSVNALAGKLFPAYEFRELPADHAIYTDEQFKRVHWRDRIGVQGLSNGSRELMILVPSADPARFWETGAYGGRESRHDIAADIFEYIAGNIQKLKKGQTFIVRPTGAGGGKPIKVARLDYGGNWDPEPGGWRRLSAIMHNAAQAELTTETVKLGDGKLAGYKIAHLTGTVAVKLSDPARAELKQFVDGGGTLIIDSCGGNEAFTSSMDGEVQTIFNLAAPLPILPVNHAVFSAGPKVEKFEYRRLTRRVVGNLGEPRLRGLEINGRVAVFLSPEDLSTGLVGVPCDGVYGYTPTTAASLMTDILLYAAR